MRISADSDGDYNDFVFQVRGATSDSPSLEELAANHHWNGSEIGQEILDYTDQSIAEYEALIEQQTEQILADIDAALDEFLSDEPAADVEAMPEAEVEAALEAVVQHLTDELTATSDRLINDLEPTITDADATFETLSDRAIAALEQTFAQSNEAEPDAIANLAKTYQFAAEDQPIVGILDTGFASDNPDINSDHLTIGSDFVEGDSDPFVESGNSQSHGTAILETIAAIQDNDLGQDGINDDARLWLSRSTGSGRWAEALVEFVEAAKQSGQPNAIANLSFDLTQIDAEGNVSTRLELTANERAALEYARVNNVLVVAAAGNNNGEMSALGQASGEFENLITVGAAKGGDRADYSSYGQGLDLLAPGEATTGESGSSIAAAKVSGIASLAWAANPELSATEIAEILTATATDLNAPGWDATTGMGLVNLAAAVTAAKAATPTGLPSEAAIPPPSFSPPESSASERQRSGRAVSSRCSSDCTMR
ncbi:MAG: S8 family serine peptidase [Spirulinaceae cyanobacterium RM2_2_10]|nr:S8 family serine peptidase [Spirulinaceae cyanobacterium RM2_2_10]